MRITGRSGFNYQVGIAATIRLNQGVMNCACGKQGMYGQQPCRHIFIAEDDDDFLIVLYCCNGFGAQTFDSRL